MTLSRSKRLRRPARRPRGAVLVEFVLVLPIFLLLLLGAIDWGWYFVLRETAIHATREGARTGSVQYAPTGSWVDTKNAAIAAAQDAVANYLTRAGFRSQSPTVSVDPITVGGGEVQVIKVGLVDYPAGSITGFRATHVPDTITVHSVMRLEVQP